MSKNRRGHERVALNMLVQFRSENVESFMSDYAPNISVGGIFIQTDQRRTPGELLYFQFVSKEDGPLIEGLGRVVRVQEKSRDRPAGIGLEFVSLEGESRALVQSIVDERSAKGASGG